MWKERWAEAAKLLKPKCAQEKDDWRWCWNLGWCYFKLGRLEFAQKYLFRGSQVSPNNASCKWALGTVYLKQKRYRKAERILAESLMLKDTHNTRIALALAYLALEEKSQKRRTLTLRASASDQKGAAQTYQEGLPGLASRCTTT